MCSIEILIDEIGIHLHPHYVIDFSPENVFENYQEIIT